MSTQQMLWNVDRTFIHLKLFSSKGRFRSAECCFYHILYLEYIWLIYAVIQRNKEYRESCDDWLSFPEKMANQLLLETFY